MREFLWQVLPARPASQNPQNPFQHTAVLDPRTTTLALLGPSGKQGRDYPPLRFGQQRTGPRQPRHRPSFGAADQGCATASSEITLFARYNHASSYDAVRFWEELAYNNVNTDTLTAGVTTALTPTMTNDFRANWSRTTGSTINTLTNFDGGVGPPISALFPQGSPYSSSRGDATFNFIVNGNDMDVREGTPSGASCNFINRKVRTC
jgi:hypothetical protein